MFNHCAFDGERVDLGGQRYEKCLFRYCELVFDGRPTELVDCTFDRCQWSFTGPAATTLEFLTLLCSIDPNVAMFIGRQLGIVHEQSH